MLIDKYLSTYDVGNRHETMVAAEPVQAYRALRSLDLDRSLVIRTLFALRNLPAKFSRRGKTVVKKPPGQPFVDFALSIGWQILEEIPDREIVCGAVTQPWKADVKFQGMSGTELQAFTDPGFTKIVWTMAVLPETAERCRVVLETRVAATDESSRRKLKIYWFVFWPFIGLIRRIILRMLKSELKSRPR